MENITEELDERNAVMCMRCGSIYTGRVSIFEGEECHTCKSEGHFNWVCGDMHKAFWGSPAQKEIAEEFE